MTSFAKPIRARTEAERRRAFFYAEFEADLYDVAADLNTPLFTLMQHTLFELVELFNAAHRDARKDAPLAVLDIGSGTGAESIPILARIPRSRLVAFDLCQPMHELFRAKAAAATSDDQVQARCRFITGDIAMEAGSTDALLAPLSDWSDTSHYDLVISALTLHHLTSDEKKLVYGRISSVLREGGLFLNADIFSYASSIMAKNANDFGINWIRRQFTNPDPELREMRDALGDRATPMMNAWIDHYINYNLPEPIESAHCGDEEEEQVVGQAEMLRKAGFSEVACPFRFWEVGILWALK